MPRSLFTLQVQYGGGISPDHVSLQNKGKDEIIARGTRPQLKHMSYTARMDLNPPHVGVQLQRALP